MTAEKRAGCTAVELSTLGETFNILATKAFCLAELLVRTSEQHDTEAAEALARQIGAIADAAAEWCGCGICVGGLRGSLIAGWFLPDKLMELSAKKVVPEVNGGGEA